jgi:hypothetical protein
MQLGEFLPKSLVHRLQRLLRASLGINQDHQIAGKPQLDAQRQECAGVLSSDVGFVEHFRVCLNVGIHDRTPTSWSKSYVGNRGKAPTAIYSFGVEPTDALHNAISGMGRPPKFARISSRRKPFIQGAPHS